MSKFITIKETMKKYGDFTVIPNLSLEIPAGEFLPYSALPAAAKQLY